MLGSRLGRVVSAIFGDVGTFVTKIAPKRQLYSIPAIRRLSISVNDSFPARLIESPSEILGFEDLFWLFTCKRSNAGIICMSIDEAAYVYRLARSLRGGTCVEVGRFRGGSTFLLAVATDGDSRVLSIDNHRKAKSKGSSYDRELVAALQKYGLNHKVRLFVADSSSVRIGRATADLVLIDGDHSYEGVRRDWRHFRDSIRVGGHVILHDAGSALPYAAPALGVSRLVREIESTDASVFARRGQTGTIVDFERV